jgi:hypothetical protein
MDDEPSKTWIKPKEPAKLEALRQALADLNIEYAISKRDKNLISINLWVGDED